MIPKFFPHPGLSVALILVWLLLLNAITVGGLVLGILVGIIVPLLTAPYWPNRPPLRFGPAMIDYVAVVLFDIMVANFAVARLILFRRNRDLRSAWLTVPLELRSPEAITVLAGTISLTPGTVTADVAADGRSLLVHALDVSDREDEVRRIKHRYERRLMRIFS
ncbi:MAG TPA: Na+/H+ antiporter subunit E [Sphingomicrobium sp.]|nr:Na+/H+ antiporter subunit E [Sphingomicrobium sp.]